MITRLLQVPGNPAKATSVAQKDVRHATSLAWIRIAMTSFKLNYNITFIFS